MVAIASMVLALSIATQKDPPRSSYALTSFGAMDSELWLDRVQELSLVRFKSRREVVRPISSNASRLTGVKLYLDSFNIVGSGKPLHVLSGSGGEVAAPTAGESYCLLYRRPNGKAHSVELELVGRTETVQIIGDEDWVTGVGLFPSQAIVKSADIQASLLLTVAKCLSRATSADEAFALGEIIRSLAPWTWKARVFGGRDASSWCPDVFEPMATEKLASQADLVKIQVLAACSVLPGSGVRRKCFELRMALEKKGFHPRLSMEYYTPAVTMDELALAATSLTRLRQYFFALINTPPADKHIRAIIGLLDSAPPDFAMEILSRLALWSGRRDLRPTRGAKATPDGMPIILNREELTKLWKENPPPIKRKLKA